MVWYEGNEIGIDEIENLPKGNYVLVKKGCELVGGPIMPKSKLISAIENTNLLKEEIEIERFEINFPNKIDWSKCAPPKHN